MQKFELTLKVTGLSMDQVALALQQLATDFAKFNSVSDEDLLVMPVSISYDEDGLVIDGSVTRTFQKEEAGPSAEYTKVNLLDVPVPRRGGY